MSDAGLAPDPIEIRGAAVRHGQHDEFRQVVGVQLDKSRLNRRDLAARRLDDELALDIALDRAVPPVKRRHRPEHTDAGRQPVVDQRAGNGFPAVADRHGRQDEDDVGHTHNSAAQDVSHASKRDGTL